MSDGNSTLSGFRSLHVQAANSQREESSACCSLRGPLNPLQPM